MPDYQALYFSMFHACEQAISLLIAAQQQCEELYLVETNETPEFQGGRDFSIISCFRP